MYKKVENLVSRGNYKKALEIINREYPKIKAPEVEKKISLLSNKVFILLRTHNLKEATESAEELYSLKNKTQKLKDRSLINHIYGLTQYKNKNFVKASKHLKDALSLSLDAKDEELEVKILDTLGQYYKDYGDVSNAVYYFKRSERKKLILKDFQGLAITYGNLGRLYFTSGILDKARDYFFLDYKISRDKDDHFGQAIMLNQIGLVERLIGNIEKSEKSYVAALKISEDMNYKLSKAFSLVGLGYTAYQKGKIDRARQHAESALHIFDDFDKKDGMIDSLILLAKIASKNERMKEAERLLKDAEKISREANIYYEMAQVLLERAYLLFAMGRVEEGLDRIEWFFETTRKVSEDENTTYRYIINIAKEITNAEDVILLLRRDTALEIVNVESGFENYFKINRKIIASWSDINNLIENKSDSEVLNNFEKWMKENNYISKQNTISALLKKHGDIIGFIVGMTDSKFVKTHNGTLNILNSYSDKISESVCNVLALISARYDILTRLKNRQLLHEDIKEEIYKSKVFKKNMGIIIMDTDNFKIINDNYGHLEGDLFLVNTANILKEVTPRNDFIYRFGGDEFLIIARNTNRKELEDISDEIISRIEKLGGKFSKTGPKISASIGIYMNDFSDSEEEYYEIKTENIINNADIALRKAKNKGKGQFCFFSENINS